MRLERLLPTLLLIMLTYSLSYSQKMVQEGSQWSVYNAPTFSPDSSTEIYRIEGDTLVDNFYYHKIYTTRDTSGVNWRMLSSLIREDSIGRVFLKEGAAEEFLLYDFDLEVNDTVPLPLNDFCELVVISIDTITLANGDQRKKFNLGNQFYGNITGDFWIEGIGSNRGPLFNMYCYTDQNFYLLCHYDNQELVYSSSLDECFITSVSNVLPSDIKIYPNPISQTLHITSQSTKLKSYRIMDLMGRVIFEERYPAENIDVSTIPIGTYILVLETEDGKFYSDKLVKL